MTAALEKITITVSPETLRKWREVLFKKYGKIFGHQSPSFEEALNLWILHETNPEELLEKLKREVGTHD